MEKDLARAMAGIQKKHAKQMEALGFDPQLQLEAQVAYSELLEQEVRARKDVGRQYLDSPLGRKAFFLGFQKGKNSKGLSGGTDETN